MKQGKKLYFPVNSQNFNAIFASESISPPSFYPKRNFGHNRFEPLFKTSDFGLLLFEEFPYFSIDHNSDIEAYLLVFEFYDLDDDNLTEIGKGVWQYGKTIYLNQDNFKLYFLDPYVKKVMLSEAKSSKTTKTVAKYEANFNDNKISKNSLKQYEITRLAYEDKSLDKKVAIDRYFNSFKGFIYCYLAGEAGKKSNIEIEFLSSIQNIINCFAQYKNELADNTNTSKYQVSSKFYTKSPSTSGKGKIVEFELNEAIRKSKQLFSHLFGKEKFEPNNWIINHLNIPQESESIARKVLSLMSRWFYDYDQVVKREYAKSSNSPILLFEIVEDNIRQYGVSSVEQRQRLDDEIKDNLFSIEKYIKAKSLESARNKDISDFEQVKLFVINEEIQISKTKLSEKDTVNFIKICNVLLKERKDFSGKANDEDLLIVIEKVWDSFELSHKKTDNPVHKYMSHKTKSIELEQQSEVMQNFIAFLLNPNSIEQLKSYVEDKKIQYSWISYSFWGLYNGFANIGRDFTNVILSTGNDDLMRNIDNYLNNILRQIELEYKYTKPIFTKPILKENEQNQIIESKKPQIIEEVSRTITIEFDLTVESIEKVLKSLEKEKAKKIHKIIDEINREYNKFAYDYRAKVLKNMITKSNGRTKKEENKITISETEKIIDAYKAMNK